MEKLRNKVICGDCIEYLSDIDQPFADLIFADPPFNIGYKYDKYHDEVDSENYIAWTTDWMAACEHVLKPSGSFYIAIGDEYAAHVRLIGDKLGLTLRNWIIWHYTFGQQTKAKFARAHTHIFYFTKTDKLDFTFNDFAVRVPSDRQLLYNDKRANGTGKMPDDVWNTVPRVCGTFKERQGWHPCQMPEILLSRIIDASSTPGDLVLDPFMGSGTTAAAALKLGRDYCGFDISENYVENISRRLDDIRREMKEFSHKHFTFAEVGQLVRLYVELNIDRNRIIKSEKLLNVFTSQFAVRMNNARQYDPAHVAEYIKTLWPIKEY